MKIVVKNIEDEANEFLVYLKTDDNINISAQFACKDTLPYIIEDLIEESGEEVENIEITYPEDYKKTNMTEQPLILVFYLDSALMANQEIMAPFAQAVNNAIAERDANAMAFFLPTTGEERIECINPVLATREEKGRITKMINEIEKSFDINQGADEGLSGYDDVNIINTGDDD